MFKFKLFIIYLYFIITTLQFNVEIENREKVYRNILTEKERKLLYAQKSGKISLCFQLNSIFLKLRKDVNISNLQLFLFSSFLWMTEKENGEFLIYPDSKFHENAIYTFYENFFVQYCISDFQPLKNWNFGLDLWSHFDSDV